MQFKKKSKDTKLVGRFKFKKANKKETVKKKQEIDCSKLETKTLWQLYANDIQDNNILSSPAREEIILRYMNYAIGLHKFFIRKYLNSISYSVASYNDIGGASLLGLVQAVTNVNPLKILDRSIKFETFAYIHIMGRMLDCLRSYQYVPRSVAKLKRDLKDILNKLTHKLQKKLTRDDLIEYFGNNSDVTEEIFNVSVFNNYEVNGDDYPEHKHLHFDCEGIEKSVIKTLNHHPDNEKKNYSTIIYGYYYLGMNIPSLAVALDCSESLIARRRQEALKILKDKLDKSLFIQE